MAKLKCSLVHAGCKFEAPTGKSWKIHASRTHGGYKESEYLALVGQSSSLPAAAGFDKAPPVTEAPAAAGPSSPTPAAGVELGAELNRTLEGASQVMAEITVKLLEQYLGLKNVTAADKQTIAEGWKAPARILNFRSEIAPVEKVVRSPLWALVFPLFSILVVVATRGNFAELFKLLDSQKQSDRGGDSPQGKRQNDPGGAADSGTSPAA